MEKMRYPNSRTAFFLIAAIFVFMISSPAYPANIDIAIRLYAEGDFVRSKDLFIQAAQSENPEDRQTAFFYLGLIETAYQDSDKADHYIRELFALNPDFDLNRYSDIIPPDFREQIEKIKTDAVRTKDATPPDGKISGIRQNYTEEDTVTFSIEAKDDSDLKSVSFEVRNSKVKKQWTVSGKSAKKSFSFSVSGWKTDLYRYTALIEDGAGNKKELKGTFQVKEGPDKTPPKGKLSNINAVYKTGDTVTYTFTVTDNKSLKEILFYVTNTYVNKWWEVEGRSVKKTSSFSTLGLKPGTYRYVLSMKDTAGNVREVTGSFDLIMPAE